MSYSVVLLCLTNQWQYPEFRSSLQNDVIMPQHVNCTTAFPLKPDCHLITGCHTSQKHSWYLKRRGSSKHSLFEIMFWFSLLSKRYLIFMEISFTSHLKMSHTSILLQSSYQKNTEKKHCSKYMYSLWSSSQINRFLSPQSQSLNCAILINGFGVIQRQSSFFPQPLFISWVFQTLMERSATVWKLKNIKFGLHKEHLVRRSLNFQYSTMKNHVSWIRLMLPLWTEAFGLY